MKPTILAIGAHPDDVELGCGGVISKHKREGSKIYSLVLTNGEKGGHTQDKSECLSSAKVLGLDDVFFGNFPDTMLKDDFEVISTIEKTISIIKADWVYTHDPNDRHQDHRNCSRAVSSAARNVPRILLYEGPSTQACFSPHFFSDLSKEDLKKKVEALKCYQSQIEKGIVDLAWVKGTALYHSKNSSTHKKFAEAFTSNHFILGDIYG